MTSSNIYPINAFPFPVFVIKDNGKIIELNCAAANLLGLKTEQAPGTLITQLLPGMQDIVQSETENPVHFQLRFSEQKMFNGTRSVLQVSDGNQVSLVTLHDISHFYQTAEKIKADNHQLTTDLEILQNKFSSLVHEGNLMLANLSHKLRTPLNAIIGYSELLQEDSNELGLNMMSADLERIKNAATDLLEVIRRFLIFAKLQNGDIQLNYVEVDLPRLVTSVTNDVLFKKNANEIFISNKLKTIKTDPEKFSDALIFLLLGLHKHSTNGVIKLNFQQFPVSSRAMGSLQIEIQVLETTLSIENLLDLFTPFKSDPVREKKPDVTDLEIAIGKMLFELLGGKFEAQSNHDSHLLLIITFDHI